jgi:hypothetical protein
MNDDTLARLVSDAVADVRRSGRRRGWYAAGGAALAAAAAVTAFAVLGGDDPRSTAPDPAYTPSPTPSMTVSTGQRAFFVGEAGQGPRLYLDVVFLPGDRSTLDTSLDALEAGPADPDYRTPWPEGSFAGAVRRGDVVEVELADAALRDRPAGMSADEAALAVEQVVRTLQLQDASERPVQFRYAGNPIDQVFGVPTSEPLSAGPALEVLSLMSVHSPLEGEELGDELVARGENNGTEATMTWRIEAADGTVVREGFATAEGWGEDHLFPWETEPIDVSDLAPGTYTFVATNPDMSDGEGFPPDTDTRSIIVE